MATFIVRVELHNSILSDYTKLKNLLLKAGFTKKIVAKDGIAYQLPNGNYLGESSKTKEEILDIVTVIAAQVKRKFSILVTKSEPKGNAWNGLPYA